MRLSRTALIPLIVAFGAAAAGCSFSANLTVPAETVADVAAGALEEEVGMRPLMDCGDGSVDLVNGTEVDCELTDEETGTVYDALVTISDVEGRDYYVNVKVADTPKSGGVPEPEQPADTDEPDATDTDEPGEGELLYAYDHEVAEITADALEAEFGAVPTVICDSDERSRVHIEVGNTVECLVVDAKTGIRYPSLVTVSEVEGTKYVVNIELGSAES